MLKFQKIQERKLKSNHLNQNIFKMQLLTEIILNLLKNKFKKQPSKKQSFKEILQKFNEQTKKATI